MIRPSVVFLLLASVGVMGLTGICIQTSSLSTHQRSVMERMKNIVMEQGLTDLCLFTEARYTRHPSTADVHSAFQDHPGALDHFPTGSFIFPPPHLRRPAGISSPPMPPAKPYQDSNSGVSSGLESWEDSAPCPQDARRSIPRTPIWWPQATR